MLVCGGRDFADAASLCRHLDRLHASTGPWSKVIHGAAPGADTLAGAWAVMRGLEVEVFPAEWERHRSKAGPKRNRRMLEQGKPDLVVAFPGGHGTAHMLRIARAAGVRVIEIESALP